MSSIDIIRMGLKNLYRRKGRTFLTVLGVIIGTAAIITMISIGLGIKNTFIEQVKQYGSLTALSIYPSMGSGGGDGDLSGSSSMSSGGLTDKAVKNMENIANVTAVVPTMQTDVIVVSGKFVNYINITGIKPEQMKFVELKIKKGRELIKGDNFSAVFGPNVAINFNDPTKTNQQTYNMNSKPKPKVDIFKDKMLLTVDSSYGQVKSPIEIDLPNQQSKPVAKLHKLTAVGLIKEGNYQTDYQAYMDINVVKKIIREKNTFNRASNSGAGGSPSTNNNLDTYQNILVKVNDVSNVKAVQNSIKKLGYQAYGSIDSLNEVEKVSNLIQLVLGGIAAISLFVASLGITNTMIMAIYERTKEIGIMKVIGAQLMDIKKMFLFEAALIGLLGGMLGSGVSFLASFVLNKVLASGLLGAMGGEGSSSPTISIIPIWLIGFALVFTTIIGIVSGYYPAKRAMKLSAIEAIKTE